MPEILSHSAAETESHGKVFGERLAPGRVVGLIGDFGAGKTAWVRGFARGAGYSGRVRSPSFGLANLYRAPRFPIWHLDLYRLDGPEAVAGAGLEQLILKPEGVTLVEWWDRWETGAERAPATLLRLRLTCLAEELRSLSYDDPGF